MPTSKSSTKVVDVPELEIVATKTTDELIMELAAKQPGKRIAIFQAQIATGMPASTIEGAFRRLERKGLISATKAMVRRDGVSRRMNIFQLKK